MANPTIIEMITVEHAELIVMDEVMNSFSDLVEIIIRVVMIVRVVIAIVKQLIDYFFNLIVLKQIVV